MISWLQISLRRANRLFGKSTSCFYLRKCLTCIRPLLSASLSLSLFLPSSRELRKTRTHPDWSAWQLSKASRSSAKQSDAAFTDPSIWQSRLSRTSNLSLFLSIFLSLSFFLSFSSRSAVTAKRFNLMLAVSLWRYWLSDLTPWVANECSEVNYSRFETYLFLPLSILKRYWKKQVAQ